MTLYFFFWHFIPCNRLRYGIKSFLKIPNAQLYISGNGEFPTEYKNIQIYTSLEI